MEYKENKKFCLLPFITLNTRPTGQVKPCSQVINMTGIRHNTTADTDGYDRPPLIDDFLNLTKDSVDDVWNSEFLKDFRMKKINGEYIRFCETCYQEDDRGGHSKRQSVIDKFYEDNKHLVKEAHANNGYMNTKPVWWEMRLSSICNEACRMCIPQTSSKMRQEFEKFADELPLTMKENTEAAVLQFNEAGYLGNSEFFLEQFFKALPDIKYLELHGGEPTNDKTLWKVIERIVESGHNKHIHIHVHTNIHVLTLKHIELWDNFKSGWIGVSIDAYEKENEYIRYGSDWKKIEKNLKLLNGLGSHWRKWVTSAIMVYNACTMHKFIIWFNKYVQDNKMHDLRWVSLKVLTPSSMRLEHIPLEMRAEAIKSLEKLVVETSCETTRESIEELIIMLTSTQKLADNSFKELVNYTKILDLKRNQNLVKVFPHLEDVFNV
jgi:hypothetical protein